MESSPQDSGSSDVGVPEVPRAPVPNGRLPPTGINILDRLIKTCPVWLQLCMSPKTAASILSEEAPGVFLVTRDAHTKCMVLWVRSAERRDPSDVLRYNIREEKKMMYLEGSFLVFEDIFKLIGFFCVSRDILPSPLRLPSAISKARTLKDLETLSNLGSGFWDSPFRDKRGSVTSHPGKPAPCGRQRSGEVSEEPSDCACEVELSAGSGRLWFVNPIFIEEFGNTQTCDQLPLNNFAANAKVQHPKVFHRRPPPPPPSLHKPPLPSLPPSAPPPEFIHPHSPSISLDSPVLTSPVSLSSSDTSLISPTQTEPLLVSSPGEVLLDEPDSQCSLDETCALDSEHPVPPSSSSVAPLVEHQILSCSGDLRSSKTQSLESGPSSKTQPLKLEPSSDTPPLESGSSSDTQPLESGPSAKTRPSKSGPSSKTQPLKLEQSSDTQPLESGPSSDTQPLESEPSSDIQPLESGPSSKTQPLEPEASSNAQPLESGQSPDASPLESEQPPTSKSSPSKTSSLECKTDVPLSPSTAPTPSQAENSSEASSNIEGSTVTDDHIVEKPSTEMRIGNTEEKKEISGHDAHPETPAIRTPVRVPPAVPKRRPSGNTPNVAFSVKPDHQDKAKSPVPKTSRPTVKPLVKQAEDHIGRQESVQQSPTKTNKVGSPRHQPKAPADGKKMPPVPPPRLKKSSTKSSPSEAGQQRPLSKSGSESPKTPETPNNVKIRHRKERQKSSASQDLKGSDSSLNSPTSGPNTPSSNPEMDSNSNSSAEEDCERPVGASIKKSHSFMLDRAKNRLSIVAITNVFSAFMSADRKLQKRITELAHDKDSYFGNLVQDYKAYSLEMMAKQSSSTEMLQEIRLMMTQLKSYLVQSTELKSMVDYNLYTDDKIDAIVEAALCKCVLKPLKAPVECYLREIHNKDGSLRLLTENQLVIQDTTTTDLGVTTSVPDSGVMEKIVQKFSTMHKTYSPEKKITYLLKACKLIYDSMATGNPGRHHGADDFLPVLMYVLARCDLVALLLDVEFMMELMDPSLQLGEGSYYLTTTYGALEHIKNYDKITVTRQLSLEVQDSIHRWERRRTLNKARVSRSSIQDFITISFEELEVNTRTLATKPDTRVAQVLQQCAEKFEVSEPHKYGLFVLVNEKFYRLAEDALPQQVKSRLLKNEQKLDFHFLYKSAGEEDTPVRDLDFL